MICLMYWWSLLTHQMNSMVDRSTINKCFIQIWWKKIELWFNWSIKDQNGAFDFQSMMITSVFNSFTWSIDDGRGNLCQYDDDNVGTVFKETCKKDCHWIVKNYYNLCKYWTYVENTKEKWALFKLDCAYRKIYFI